MNCQSLQFRVVAIVIGVLGCEVGSSNPAMAQVAGVRILPDAGPDPDEMQLLRQAETLRVAGELLSSDGVKEQMTRKSCDLRLPPVRTTKLSGREIWRLAQTSHLRVGWYHRCAKCERWHLKLSGGYAITADGAVVLCAHTLQIDEKTMKESFLVAASEAGQLFPIKELLAFNGPADVVIVRAVTQDLVPLPLSTEVAPGDSVWCYSDPVSSRGYFSRGIVNRFVAKARTAGSDPPIVMHVSTEWAPGSSGSALLDECGNAIGHVSRINQLGRPSSDDVEKSNLARLVVHEAVSAHDVLRLISPASSP